MTTFNRAFMVGHLEADPEVRETQKGDTVATFRIATDRDSGGDGQDSDRATADCHNVVAWDKLAEVVRDHVRKGMTIYVEGRLQNRSYELPDETTMYVTEIRLEMLSVLSCAGGDRIVPPHGLGGPAGEAAVTNQR